MGELTVTSQNKSNLLYLLALSFVLFLVFLAVYRFVRSMAGLPLAYLAHKSILSNFLIKNDVLLSKSSKSS